MPTPPASFMMPSDPLPAFYVSGSFVIHDREAPAWRSNFIIAQYARSADVPPAVLIFGAFGAVIAVIAAIASVFVSDPLVGGIAALGFWSVTLAGVSMWVRDARRRRVVISLKSSQRNGVG